MNATRCVAYAAMAAAVLSSIGCPRSDSGGGDAEVTAILPPEGADAGGLSVLIEGSNFEDGPASVYFDGVPATDVQVLSDTQIRCTTPPGAIGRADVEVRSSGNVGTLDLGFEYLPGVESKEEPDASGGNDVFATYERVPIEYDFRGFIGSPQDVDIFHLHPPADGRVFITLTWDSSFSAGGIASMALEYYQGPDPTPEPDAFFGGSITAVSDGINTVTSIEDWMRPAFLIAGAHGPYLLIRGFGDGNHTGFDPVNAYTLRIEYEPDATFEPAPQADSFRVAQTLDFDENGRSAFTTGGDYDDDFDWYRFSLMATTTGWARVTISGDGLGTIDTAGELNLNAKLFWVDPSDADGNHVYAVDDADVTITDLPGTTGAVFEVGRIEPLQSYVLRLWSSTNDPAAPAFEYDVTVEVGAGGFEADEPGALLPADDETAANDLGDLSAPVNATGYLFHDGDDDWFTVTSVANSNIVVDWDYANIADDVNGIGFYDAQMNPFGGEFALLVFDQAWYDSSGQLATTPFALDYDVDPAETSHSVTFSAADGETYYILLNGVRGWSTSESYTLTVSQP